MEKLNLETISVKDLFVKDDERVTLLLKNHYYEIVDADYNNTGRYCTYYEQAAVVFDEWEERLTNDCSVEYFELPKDAIIVGKKYRHFD